MARIKQGLIDVILIDLNLPDSLGFTTLPRLQPKASRYPLSPRSVRLMKTWSGSCRARRPRLSHQQQIVSAPPDKAQRQGTERKHTLLALKASETRYRELYENVVADEG